CAALGFLLWKNVREPARVLRSSIPPPAGGIFWLDPSSPGPPALSPDGRKLAFSARGADGKTLLHVRSLDAVDAVALPGTDEAQYPFWSPDSKTIAFFAGNKLKAVESAGGPPVSLCSVDGDPKGGSWSPTGVIVFARGSTTTLSRVPS